MVTPTTFKSRFTEFSSIDDNKIQVILDEVLLLISNFGTLQDVATNYLTAHLLTISINQSNGNTSQSQSIASKSVGDVSVSYANPITSSSDSFYSSTSYGQMYLDLKKRIAKGNCRIV